jgi:hypothetical protein
VEKGNGGKIMKTEVEPEEGKEEMAELRRKNTGFDSYPRDAIDINGKVVIILFPPR